MMVCDVGGVEMRKAEVQRRGWLGRDDVAVTLTKKIFGNMKRGFRGAPRPFLLAMLLVATTNPNAGKEHPEVAQSQPSSSTILVPSTSLPPVPSPPPTTTPIPASTPTPIPETDPEPMEHTFEEPSPTHQHFSPPQEHVHGPMTLDDLLQVVPQLMTRIDSLEKELKQTKLTMGSAIVKLVKKVKKLEGILKRKNVVFSDSEEEEPEDQGRKSQDDPLVSLVQGLVTPSKSTVNISGEEQVEDISPNTLEAAKTLSRVASQKPKSIDKGRRYKRRKETKGKKVVTSLDFQEEVNTGAEEVNTAEGVNTGSIKVSTVSGQVSTDSITKSIPSPDKGQREGKAPMIIEEAPKKTKEQILQEEASLAEAIRLDTLEKEEEAKQVHLDSLLAQRIAEEEELNEQQKKRRAQVQFEAQHYTDEDWDLIRAKIEANAELSKSVLGSDLQGEDFAKKMVELVNQRKKHFAEERARAKRNKPMTQSQLRTYMMNYLKNQGTWKLSQLKNLSFEEVKEEFDKLVKQVESFAPINFEATKDSLKRFGEELQTKTSKRLKSDEAKDDESTKKTGKRRKQIARKGLHSDKTDEDESEDSKDDDPISGTNIPINPVPVAIKPPSIATYKIIKQGEKGVNTGSINVNTVSGQVSTDSIKKSIPSPDKGQREGKAPMIIEEAPKKTKEQILQEEASLAEAIRLDTLEKEEEAKQVHLDSLLAQRIAEEEELNEQQKKRRAQVQFEAQHYTDEDWDLIRAKIEANAELSKSVLGSDLQGEDFAKKMVDLVNQRKKHFAEERARAKRNKPMTQSQLRTYMMNYLKNQGTWKLSQLKNLSFEEVKEEFDKLVKQVESFAPINFEATKDSLKRFGEELQTKTSKRLKSDEAKDDESTKKTGKRRKQIARKGLHSDKTDKDDSEDSDEASEQDDSASGTKIPINPVPVAMKSPSIVTYKIIKQGERGVYQIVREDGTDIVYINFGAMLKDITRDDLTELYRIVMNRYGMNGPEDELEKVLWGYLKNIVHCLNLESMDIYMLIERQYPLSAEVCKAMLDKKLQGGKPDENCYKMLK
ncbi:hypothetical protein Tco_0525052 [Tanacetum coccineum]